MSDIKMRHITFNFSLLMQETSTSSNTLMHFMHTHKKIFEIECNATF